MTIIANPGINQQKFTVSRVLICSRSKYFDRALNGKFKESKRKEVELHDVDLQSLQALLYWLYHNKLQPGGNEIYVNGVEDQEVFLVRLSILADRLLVPALQNVTFKKLCHRVEYHRLPADTIVEIYEDTAPSSHLRRLASHVVACITLRLYCGRKLGEYSSCFAELEDFGADVCRRVNVLAKLHVDHVTADRPRATFLDYEDFLVKED